MICDRVLEDEGVFGGFFLKKKKKEKENFTISLASQKLRWVNSILIGCPLTMIFFLWSLKALFVNFIWFYFPV